MPSEFPRRTLLGNWASGIQGSRKSSFVLCSAARTAPSVGYTGLPSQEGGVAQSRSSRKLERREEKVTLLRKPELTAFLVHRSGGTRKLWAWQKKARLFAEGSLSEACAKGEGRL